MIAATFQHGLHIVNSERGVMESDPYRRITRNELRGGRDQSGPYDTLCHYIMRSAISCISTFFDLCDLYTTRG